MKSLPKSRPLTEEDKRHVQRCFESSTVDFSLFSGLIYFDGWCGHEEGGGIIIFRGIDDSIHLARYGHNVFQEGPTEYYLREVSEEEALEEITHIEAIKGSDF